jgi:hypothetical protein
MYLLQSEVGVVIDAVKSTGLDGWPLAVVIIIIIAGFVFLRLISMPKLVKKETKGTVETITREEVNNLMSKEGCLIAENEAFVRRLENIEIALVDIEKNMTAFQNTVVERFNTMSATMQNISHKLMKTSEGTLENMLFTDSPKLSMYKRLKAYRRLIAMGKNGRIRNKGLNLILENKETWLDVLDSELDIEIINQKYFDSVMEDIENRIFRG